MLYKLSNTKISSSVNVNLCVNEKVSSSIFNSVRLRLLGMSHVVVKFVLLHCIAHALVNEMRTNKIFFYFFRKIFEVFLSRIS